MISSWYANRRFTEIDYNMPMGSLFVSEWPNYISKLIYKKKNCYFEWRVLFNSLSILYCLRCTMAQNTLPYTCMNIQFLHGALFFNTKLFDNLKFIWNNM